MAAGILPSGTNGDSAFGTMGDVAKICGVSRSTVRKWVADGTIVAAKKEGKALRFDLAEIRRLRDRVDLIWLDGQNR